MNLIEEAERLAKKLEPYRFIETGDAAKTIRALVDRLKAADEVVEASQEFKVLWCGDIAYSKLNKAKEKLWKALAKYKGEGDVRHTDAKK